MLSENVWSQAGQRRSGCLLRPGKLIFTAAGIAPTPTSGRKLDHPGFNMLNAKVLGAYSKTVEEKGAKVRAGVYGHDPIVNDFGTNIEVTKAQGGYFDTKLLDEGYYQVDEGGQKQGETPAYSR